MAYFSKKKKKQKQIQAPQNQKDKNKTQQYLLSFSKSSPFALNLEHHNRLPTDTLISRFFPFSGSVYGTGIVLPHSLLIPGPWTLSGTGEKSLFS